MNKKTTKHGRQEVVINIHCNAKQVAFIKSDYLTDSLSHNTILIFFFLIKGINPKKKMKIGRGKLAIRLC
jgi:hypothetical protein